MVDGGRSAGEDSAQSALLAEVELIEILACLVGIYMLILGDHAAAVHFLEDQLLFFLRYFALDLKVVFEVLFAGGEEQYLDVDKSFEGLELEVAGRLFREEFRRRSFDALAGDVDIADAGEDVGTRR